MRQRSLALLRTALVAATVACSASPGHAISVGLDQFSVVRDGSTLFSDGFADGNPPPSAPNFSTGGAASYSLLGSFGSGTEAAGRLQLDSANGGATANAAETARLTLAALLATSITGGASQLGTGNTLAQTAVFDLVTPAGPAFAGYGIQFTDASPTGTHQLAQVYVRFNEISRVTEVAYILQDFDANTITGLGATPLAPPAGSDQIALTLTRPSAANNNFFASFSYLAGGTVVGGGSFATPAALFQGEDYVRARFFVSQAAPVPEPASGWLMAFGAALMLARRRRRH